MCLEFLNKYRNIGFLILRFEIGGMFIFHGSGKLFAGPGEQTLDDKLKGLCRK